jgi:ribonuclease E
VKHYSDPVPLFQRAHVEDQLSAMYHPVVQLKSGGYLVINPTEALVSIDINSGRSTREHNIEQTATATNLEATHEISRQLRLRDMAGLVVIDFIDMDNNSNVRKVEKAMKEALKNDRARIQVGRISSFGLMEMSRQRLRTGVLEASTRQCPHCEGTGLVRTASSAGLSALRMIEDEAAQGRGSQLLLRASTEAAVYVLNRKRAELAEIEDRYGVFVEIVPDGEQEGARMSVEVSGPPPAHAPRFDAPIEEIDDDLPEDIEDEIEEEEAEDEVESKGAPRAARPPREERGEGTEAERAEGRKRRRRRGRRGRNREEGDVRPGDAEGDAPHAAEGDEGVESDVEVEAEGEETPREAGAEGEGGERGEGRRRRGRRGRRGGRRPEGERAEGEAGETTGEDVAEADTPVEVAAEPVVEEEAPKKGRRRPRARAADAVTTVAAPVAAPVEVAEVVEAAPEPAAKPKRSRKKAAPEAAPVEVAAVAPEPVVEDAPVAEAPAEEAKPKRRAPRRKAAEAAVETVADVAAEEAPALAPVESAPTPAAVKPAILASDADADENADPGEAGSPRRGWWQRTFGA